MPTDGAGDGAGRADRPHAPRHQGFGHAPEIGPATRLECKVCWTVYDPAEGDPHWQIAPGTPFTALPPHWTCPNCSATQDQFIVLAGD